MVKFVGLESGEFGSKFSDDEIIGCVFVPVAENPRVTKMKGVRLKILDRKDVF